MDYLRCVLIILLSIAFVRFLSKIIAKLIFSFFKKFSSAAYLQQFVLLLLYPLQGLLLTVTIYVALNQLDMVFGRIILFRRPVALAGSELAKGYSFSLMKLIDHAFFLSFIFSITLFFSRLLDFVFSVLITRAVERGDRSRQQVLPLLRDVVKVVVWCIGFFIVLGVVFHVNIPTLIAGLGVGGIAIAFAAKETLENLLASFMVMIDKPFTIGDWIKVDGVEGTVEKVGFRSTRIRSFDKTIVTMPNRSLIDGQLENFSERGMRRVKLTVGAVYGLSQQTLETIIAAIKELINTTKHTMGSPTVYLDNFGDSSVNILVVYYVSAKEIVFEDIKQEINFGIYQIMYQYGQGFAYPTQAQLTLENPDDVESRQAAPAKD